MSMLNIFSGKLAQSLCWMLVHSLWMGLVLTVITGIIMLCTKNNSAALRYRLLVAALLLFTIAIITVLTLQITALGNTVNQQVAATTASTLIDTNNSIPVYTITENKADFTTSIINFFNANAGIIVLFWLLIILFRCAQFIIGLRKINQLKTQRLLPVDDYWNQRLASLSAALNIRSNIKFFQSGLAKIPMVVGHFKPVILFPVSLLTSLPAAEVEAVLIHELAHIRRKDYLVNMLQHFIEILFFFNPAILWVSALIKIERENCCDDIALAQTSSKRNYINALVSFQEYNLSGKQYTPAIAGTKDHLLQRVKRMLYNNNKTLNSMEKTFLTLCLVAAASLTVFFSRAGSVHKNNAAFTAATTDSLPPVKRSFNADEIKEGASVSYTEKVNGISHTLYIFKRKGVLYEIYGDITYFKIDGKEVPQAEWDKYRKLIEQLRKDYKQTHETITSETNTTRAETEVTETAKEARSEAEQVQLKAEQEKLVAEQNVQNAKLEKEQAELEVSAKTITKEKDKQQAETNKLKMEADKLMQQSEKLKVQVEKKQVEADSEKQKAEQLQQKLKAEKDAQQQKGTAQTSGKREITRTVDDGNTVINSSLSYSNGYNYTYPKEAYKPYAPGKNQYILTGIQTDGAGVNKDIDIKELTNNVIADLIEAKVITNAASLSYKVTNESLIVNGKVQPEALHQQLKEKYIQSADWKLLYNWKN